MEYLFFGFATGIFVCGLIEKFHKKESSWIKPSFLFGFSALGFSFFVYLAWPLLEQIFS